MKLKLNSINHNSINLTMQKALIPSYGEDSVSFGEKIKTENPTKTLTNKEKEKCLFGIQNLQNSIKTININTCDIKLDKNGKIKTKGYVEFEQDLNNAAEGLFEFKNTIGKYQHGTEHFFTLDKHCLKVAQNIVNDKEFEKLTPKDKQIMLIVGLMHDVSKEEGKKDPHHPENSAICTYRALEGLGLDEKAKKKAYTLIKTHHWLEIINKAGQQSTSFKENEINRNEAIYNTALSLKDENNFELSKMLCRADLKSVRADDSFFYALKTLYDDFSSKIENEIQKINS